MAMKLYIWSEPYHVPYGSSLLVVVAEGLDEAKREARRGSCFKYGEFEGGQPPNISLGEPLRVVDLPCAEWHEWSE